jgi:glucose/arabinose dehydrogenase
LTTILGKILRIDVDAQSGSPPDCKGLGTGGYTIPAGNPLVDGLGGKCDEIWIVGLRNPWRFSFDRLTGDMYIADVGEQAWEEIDFQWSGSVGGRNYGWRCYEGNHPHVTTGCKPQGAYNFPIFEYSHNPHCSVIGGYVYRGSQFPAMYGRYLLTDFCSGHFWDLIRVSGQWQATTYTHLVSPVTRYVAFGEDSQGELYVVAMSAGAIYRLVENTAGSAGDQPRTSLYLPVIVRLNSP